ncbi:carbohydrate ABC transporter permease [Cohnella cellulosilytica]|uniref:Carbohydrate ABC transporter permease n=1 Tax=Cohnella cellulosilytica TaxID=986710 RepID=A0ABW2F4H5_9BACL
MQRDHTFGGWLFDKVNIILLIGFAAVCILPFIYIIAGSFSTAEDLGSRGFILFPKHFSLDAYQYLFSTPTLSRSLAVSVFITVAGTLINLVFTSLMAYPLARKDLDGRRPIMLMVIFSMLFSGGMIPTFLVVKELGIMDTYWAVLIPGAISAFNLIILKNFFQQMPEGIEESAKIDGCNELSLLIRIVLPLSAPAMATFALFYSVGHWNMYFDAILYLNDPEKWPVQVLLRQIVILSQGGVGDSQKMVDHFVPPSETIKMATIVLSTVPILCLYPFLQKHFAKGILLGSVKG